MSRRLSPASHATLLALLIAALIAAAVLSAPLHRGTLGQSGAAKAVQATTVAALAR